MTYSPEFVTFEDVPIQIPDDYSNEEKAAALEFAESSLKLDINDGEEIPQDVLDEIDTLLVTAVRQKATCELAKGAEAPSDVALTDLSDTGADKADYATEAFCDRYDEIVEKIQYSGLLEGEDGDEGPLVVTTEDPRPDDEYYERNVDEDSFNRTDEESI
jgi:hypothetical protein